MKTYESIIILDENKIQDEGKSFTEEFSLIVSKAGGKMIKETPVGRKQFAREIKKRKTGFYLDYIFNLNETEIVTLPDKYRLDKRVLRMQIFIYKRSKPIIDINK